MKDFNFKNKNILVTGSSSGIGFFIAKDFIDCGGNVILNGRNNSKLIKAKKLLGASEYVKSDLSKYDKRKYLIKEIKKRKLNIDILVCNVGMSSPPKYGLKSNTSWINSLEANFLSASHLVSLMSDKVLNKGSSVICISSICSIRSLGCPITYACAKSALNTFVEQEAIRLAKKNIRINTVIPGNILFDGSVWQKKIKLNKISIREMIEKKVPMKRFGTPQEVSNAVLFLASDLSSFTTGSKILVDGGQTL
jgi:3-oxoacyl-[acyl-carrier protein] reductase